MSDDHTIDDLGEVEAGGREKGKVREATLIIEAHVHPTIEHDRPSSQGDHHATPSHVYIEMDKDVSKDVPWPAPRARNRIRPILVCFLWYLSDFFRIDPARGGCTLAQQQYAVHCTQCVIIYGSMHTRSFQPSH